MPKPTPAELHKPAGLIASTLRQLEYMHPEAVIAALDLYASNFATLRADCQENLDAEHDHQISNA